MICSTPTVLPPSPRDPAPLADVLGGARVALALRDPAARERIADALRGAGCAVRTHADATEVLLDPERDGALDAVVAELESRLESATVCNALRGRFGPRLSIVALGRGGEDEALARRAFDAGADDCVLTPTPELVLAELRLQLRRRAATPTRPISLELLAPCADPVPPCRFAGFELVGVLGRGGFGTVYAARRLTDGACVALKLLSPDAVDDRTLLARFLREVSALSTLRSPRVVRVLGTGYERGRYFLVMERVQGRPATALTSARGRAAPGDVLRVAHDVCSAIEALHACELVHRDIKPSNILVDPRGRALLIDFGLAKRQRDVEATGGGGIMGTAPYLAPEVVRGAPQDTGSDLYALGVTMWELLAGGCPFQAPTALELLQSIASGRPAPEVRSVRADIPTSVSWFVSRLMEPDPALRLADPQAARRTLWMIAQTLEPRVEPRPALRATA